MHATKRQEKFGPLNCTIVDSGDKPDILVVLCHGYGAPGTDLVPLAGEWISILGDQADRFRFVFPEAPSSLADQGMPDGRAWWPINMARLMAAVEAKQFNELHAHEPPGIDEARRALSAAIAAAKESFANDGCKKFVLGGFSQGAMVTLDTALRGLVEPPEILIQFSGTLVCEDSWESSIDRLSQTLVYQSHGSIDPVLPISSAQELHELIKLGQSEAKFDTFYGPHTISGDAVVKTAAMMNGLCE